MSIVYYIIFLFSNFLILFCRRFWTPCYFDLLPQYVSNIDRASWAEGGGRRLQTPSLHWLDFLLTINTIFHNICPPLESHPPPLRLSLCGPGEEGIYNLCKDILHKTEKIFVCYSINLCRKVLFIYAYKVSLSLTM